MEERDAVWAATFLECEGCFYAYWPGKVGVFASQVGPLCVRKIDSIFPGKVKRREYNGPNSQPIWTWRVTKPQDVIRIADVILPHMLDKRPQVELMREFAQSIRIEYRQGGVPLEVRARRFAIIRQLKRHKHNTDVSSTGWKEVAA